MMRILSGLVVVAFLSVVGAEPPEVKELSPVPAPPPVKVTDPIPVELNKYRIYSIVGYTGEVTWQIVGKSVGTKEADKAMTLFGVISGQVEPGEYPVPAGALIVWGREQGLTAVAAWGVVNGKAKQLASLSFIVGPAPPGPVDPTDPVLTPFQVTLQDAYHVDVATKGATAAHKAKYAALWRVAAKTTVYDPAVVTPAALMKEMTVAVKNLGIPPGSLDNTARAVANEINPLMPKPSDGTMSKEVRDSVSALFTRISNDLEVIK